MADENVVSFADVLKNACFCDIRKKGGVGSVFKFFNENRDATMNLSEVGHKKYFELMNILKNIDILCASLYQYGDYFYSFLFFIDHSLMDNVNKLTEKTYSSLDSIMAGTIAEAPYRKWKEIQYTNDMVLFVLDSYSDLNEHTHSFYKLLKDLAAQNFTKHTYTLAAREDMIEILCNFGEVDLKNPEKRSELCKMLFENQNIGSLNCLELAEIMNMWGWYDMSEYRSALNNVLIIVEKNTDYTQNVSSREFKTCAHEILTYRLFGEGYVRDDFMKIFKKMGNYISFVEFEKLLRNFNECDEDEYSSRKRVQLNNEIYKLITKLLSLSEDENKKNVVSDSEK